MADANEIRLENMTETLRQIQRYIILGIGSSIILLSVIVQAPEHHESGATVSLPFIGDANFSVAGFTLIVSGFYLWRCCCFRH